MNKLALIIASLAFIAFISLIGVLASRSHALAKENAELQGKLANASTLLDTQNKQILQDKLDIESYKAQAAEHKERVITRYINTHTADKDCQAQLNAIKGALEIFYTRDK